MNFFITNREIIGNFPNESIREDGLEHAGDNLRFGQYLPNTKQFLLFEEPATTSDISYVSLDQMNVGDLKGSARFFKELYDVLSKDKVNPKSDVLFFIHGFNTNLESVRKNFEHLQTLYVNDPDSTIAHIVAFTWPSMHKEVPLHYFNDEKDAERSGMALARAIYEKLIPFFQQFLKKENNLPCERKIHMMVHSMGNRVLKHMMRELKDQTGLTTLPELFDEILLIAADIEYDMFEKGKEFENLIDMGKRVHVYYNRKDIILDISKYTKNMTNRLGRYGRKNASINQTDVYEVDVSETIQDMGDFEERNGRHWYYYSSTKVVKDIAAVMSGNRVAYERELGI